VVKNFKNLPQISQIIGIHSNEIIRIIIIRGEKNGMILCLYVVKNFKNLPQISQIMRINLNKILLNPFNPWPKKQTKALFNEPKPIQKKAILFPSEILIFALLNKQIQCHYNTFLPHL
jgi:hypothetical protein